METAAGDNEPSNVMEMSGDGGVEEESEEFRVQVDNMNQHVSVKQVKQLLKKISASGSGRSPVQRLRVLTGRVYFTVQSEQLRSELVDELNGYRFKGKELSAKAIDGDCETNKRKRPLDLQSESADIRDVVTPLWKMSYEEQLRSKLVESKLRLAKFQKMLKDANRAGGGDRKAGQVAAELAEILPSPRRECYRNKCEFSVGLDENGEPAVGFLAVGGGNANSVRSVEHCIHLSDAMKSCVRKFGERVREQKKLNCWKMLTVREHAFDTMIIVQVDGNAFEVLGEGEKNKLKSSLVETYFGDGSPRVTSLFLQKSNSVNDRGDFEHLAGAPFVYESLLGMRFRISPTAFFQTNTAGAEVMYRVIGELADLDKEDLLLDLCCGTGTIGISLANKVKGVLGVELCREAVEDARENALNNRVVASNCRFVWSKVEQAFFELKHYLPRLDENSETTTLADFKRVVAVLDPPRAGVHSKLIAAVRQFSALTRLVYVSCEPRLATSNFVDLCRPNSNKFGGRPFILRKIVPVDMFPQTSHFEWVMLFERTE